MRRRFFKHALRSLVAFVLAYVSCAMLLGANEPAKEIQEHKAMPKPGGDPTLRLDVQMARAVWGEWERVRFDYRIVNATKKAIQFEDGDSGRGFAGKIMFLRDPDGKIRAFGAHWAHPVQYKPSFPGRPKSVDPGAVAYEQAGLEPSGFFGRLGTGKHSIQVLNPAGRLTVGGKLTLQLASAPVDFDVVALTPELRRKLNETPKDVAGVSLEPVARAVKLNKADRSVKLRLANNSNATILFSQYLGTNQAPTEAENFGGDGRWHKESIGWCAAGLDSTTLDHKQAVTISTHAPSESGRFVRFKLGITEKGKSRTVVSPVIELTE